MSDAKWEARVKILEEERDQYVISSGQGEMDKENLEAKLAIVLERLKKYEPETNI